MQVQTFPLEGPRSLGLIFLPFSFVSSLLGWEPEVKLEQRFAQTLRTSPGEAGKIVIYTPTVDGRNPVLTS